MGLLSDFGEFIKTPEGQGLLSTVVGGMAGARQGTPWNNLGRAGVAGLSGFANAQEMQAKLAEAEQMKKFRDAQMQNYQSEADARKAAAQRQAVKDAALANPYKEVAGSGGFSLPTDASGQPVFSGDFNYAPVTPSKKVLDVDKLLSAKVTPKEIEELNGLSNLGKNEVARTIEVQRPDGVYTVSYDKYGQPVGEPQKKYTAPIHGVEGGDFVARDPITMQPIVKSPVSMTWGDKAAQGQLGVAQQRLAFERSKENQPKFNEAAGGFIYNPDMKNPNGKLVPLAGFNGSGKMTEDQAKAAGWFAQASNAWDNMQQVGIGKDGKVLSAAKPGLNDALDSVGLSTLANAMRTPDRQKFIQASSSLSEALLRAATGAGVNKDEAAQKIKEIVPQFGEDAATTKQKFESIPLYLKSLEMRAGPGAAKVQSILANRPSASGVRFLGFE